MEYFGDPLYTYSLKQGIDDGFLAPYKVIRVTLNTDTEEGWRPGKGKRDKSGNEVEDRVYNRKDYDKTLVIDERTATVAKKVTEFLKGYRSLCQNHCLLCRYRPCRKNAPCINQRKR